MARSSHKLTSQFSGLSPSFQRYREFLSRVVMDFAPTHISEHGKASGALQTVAYSLPRPVACYLADGTDFRIGLANRADIIVRGGAQIIDWASMHIEIVLYTKKDAPQLKSLPQPHPLLFKKTGVGAELLFLTDETRFQDLRDAVQHGFSVPTAQEIMHHFHPKIMWMRALLADCDTARLRMIEYVQSALRAECEQAPCAPHHPREWDAYCHLALCRGGECRSFAREWDNTFIQTKIFRWMELYEKREKLFRSWGIHP